MGVMVTMWRGMGRMPHVGEHPGNALMICLVAIAAVAGGERGGIVGVIFGAAFMAGCIGPFYLKGAYDRARLSEKLSAQDKAS